MAKPTKTKYYDDVAVVCTNGGFEYVLGLTMPELTIDVCGRSHPFYTGKESFIDTTGRIDKFAARLNKMNTVGNSQKSKNKKARKFKQTLADLNQSDNTAGKKQPKNESRGKSQPQSKAPDDVAKDQTNNQPDDQVQVTDNTAEVKETITT